MPDETLRIEELLCETRWLRALARRLARRGCDVDDLVQDARLLAMQQPPADDRNPRGWLAAVMRNLVRQGGRADARRDRRQLYSASQRENSAPPADELVARAAMHRAVVDAVLCLDEPHRTVVLMRYFEDEPPRAIARRLGIPIATVHTRLQRAHAQVRRHLDRRCGGRAAWAAAFAPLVPPPLALLGLLAMNKTILAAGTVLLGALAITLVSLDWHPDAPASAAVTAAGANDPARSPTPPRTPDAGAGTRTAAAVPAPATPAEAAADPAPLRASGRVVDSEGQPVPDLRVRVVEAELTGTAAREVASDAAGHFELPFRGGSISRVVVAEPGWRTVMAAMLGERVAPKLALVVAARAVALRGMVRGADGAAIPGARLSVVWPGDLRSRLSDISDAATDEPIGVVAGDDGTFALAAARVRGAELRTAAEGFVPDQRQLPEFDGLVDIVLARPEAREGSLQGQVVDAGGHLIAGASVVLGSRSARSDAEGAFVLTDIGRQNAELAVAHPGHRRGVLARPEAGWPPFVVIALGGAPLSIAGRVVDAAGEPVADAKVWIVDPTLHDRAGPSVAEGIAAAAMDIHELIARARAGEIQDPEKVVPRTSTTLWPFVFTDAEGNFVLPGLEDRAYDLRACAMDTLLMADTAGVPAGSRGVAIRLPSRDVFARIAGVVEAGDGTPVPGVSVRTQCDTFSAGSVNMHGQGSQRTVTDENGRFHLERVPCLRVYLRLDGETILPLEYGRRVDGGLQALANGDPEHLRLVVTTRRHMQAELADPNLADTLVVLDARGKVLDIDVFEGQSRRTTDALELQGGKSPVFVVADTAATVVLKKAGAEVRRAPLVLRAGDVNKLAF